MPVFEIDLKGFYVSKMNSMLLSLIGRDFTKACILLSLKVFIGPGWSFSLKPAFLLLLAFCSLSFKKNQMTVTLKVLLPVVCTASQRYKNT